jgi:SAM-dependent methyltransferase
MGLRVADAVSRGPNDDAFQESLDISHHIFRLTLDGDLFIAPIGPTPQRVLDLGTGTGIWAIDFADMYPSASVIGTDLSPIQPSLVPTNLQFEVDDFELEWTYTKESFDFIHARALYGSVSDYGSLYRQVMAHLKPGGWFEETEVGVVPYSDDGSIRGTTLEEWGELSLTAGERFGRTLRIVDQTRDLMEAAGFSNITYRTFKWPMGPWAKDPKLKKIGLYNRMNWEEGMEGWLMFLFTTFHQVGCPGLPCCEWMLANSAVSGLLIRFECTSLKLADCCAPRMYMLTR